LPPPSRSTPYLWTCRCPSSTATPPPAPCALRQHFPDAARLPIISLTASVLPKDRSLALAAGMNDLLAKPFEPAVLYARLAHFTGRLTAPADTDDARPPPYPPARPHAAPQLAAAGRAVGRQRWLYPSDCQYFSD